MTTFVKTDSSSNEQPDKSINPKSIKNRQLEIRGTRISIFSAWRRILHMTRAYNSTESRGYKFSSFLLFTVPILSKDTNVNLLEIGK